MKNRTLLSVTAVLLSSVVAAPVLATSTPPRQDPAVQTTSGGISAADLLGLIKGLGYEVANLPDSRYEIEMKQGIYTLHPMVALSPSGKKVWLTASVRSMSAEDMANADFLLKLLKANASIGPAQFYVENVAKDGQPADWRLSYGYPIDNRGITAEIIKSSLDTFATSLVENASIWDNSTTKPKTGN